MSITVQMVKIPVSDIAKAAPFYREILGLHEDFIVPEYGWAQFSAGNLPVSLYVPGKGGGDGQAGSADCVHFAVDDGARFREQLVTAGLKPADHFHTGNEGTHYYELQDPDGNTFKVIIPGTDD